MGGIVVGVLGFALFLFIIFGLDLLFAMIGYGIQLALIALSIWFIVNSIIYIVRLIKEKHIIEPIIIIALLATFSIINFPYMNKFAPFDFEFTFIAKKILGLGILGLCIWIRESNNDNLKSIEDLKKIFIWITIIVMCVGSGILIANNSFNKTLFVSQNAKMEIFWNDRRIKKEAKKQNLRTELELVLNEYKKDKSLEFSKEGINKVITKFGYKPYNGISCYAIEDTNETTWLVGMYYGDASLKISINNNLSDTGNYYVDKNTFEITGVYSETKPQE